VSVSSNGMSDDVLQEAGQLSRPRIDRLTANVCPSPASLCRSGFAAIRVLLAALRD
jgi:hypothetical protein